MKRLLALTLAALLILCSAAAELPDISGLTFDELVALRDQLNLAIWQSSEWQEVTVPAGVWVVGQDIPAGHWTIRPVPGSYTYVCYCNCLNEFGTDPGIGWLGWGDTLNGYDDDSAERREVDLNMVDGMYFINTSDVVFTPFAGKQNLWFK